MKHARKVSTTQHVSVRLTGEDGNVFAVIGRTARALRRAGFPDEAAAYAERRARARRTTTSSS